MACLESSYQNALCVTFDIQKRDNDAENARIPEFKAARTIQRWVRGYLVRQHVKLLTTAAVKIQKVWRGFLGRRLYRQILRQRVEDMYLKHYNHSATVIQKSWRGYRLRKMFNYYELKTYLKDLREKNKEITGKMEAYRQQVENDQWEERNRKAKERIGNLLVKIHPMMRTASVPGVFSVSNSRELSELEKQLRSVRFPDKKFAKEQLKAQLKGAKGGGDEGYPPLGKIVQGPIPYFEDVWEKKTCPLNPSLAATGAYDKAASPNSVKRSEDPLLNVSQVPFRPASAFPKKKVKDDANLLLERGKYGLPKYGRKYFREPDNSKNKSNHDFRRIFPS